MKRTVHAKVTLHLIFRPFTIKFLAVDVMMM